MRWLYGTPDTPPYGLLPNMGESRNPGREQRPGFSGLSVSLAEPCPRLTPVITIIWVGEWVSCKKPPFSISSSGEPSRYFPATEGSRFVSLNHRPLADLNAPFASHCLRSAFGAKRKSTGSQNRLEGGNSRLMAAGEKCDLTHCLGRPLEPEIIRSRYADRSSGL